MVITLGDALVQVPWEQWQKASCFETVCFCEKVHFGEWILQPINSWTSLSFVVLALIILIRAKRQPRHLNNLTETKGYSVTFSLALLLTGLMSFFFHASLTFVGQWLDLIGMYLTVSFFLFYNIERLLSLNSQLIYLIYWLFNILVASLAWYLPGARRFVFGVILVLFVLLAIYTQLRLKTKVSAGHFFLALLFFAFGFGLWYLDLEGIWCGPGDLAIGHGLWHILSAFAGLHLYLFYESEVRGRIRI